MPQRSPALFHVGLTADSVIDAAVDLTHESHLFSWSIRDLARRLAVTPSSIYHHVGGKDLLSRCVVERVAGRFIVPDPELDWQSWFRGFLFPMGPVAMDYPGVAKWILMHGPTVQAVFPALGAGLRTLRHAGFGDDCYRAYAVLVNTAATTIAIGDDRLQHEEDGPRDHSAMMRDFEQIAARGSDTSAFSRAMIHPFTGNGTAAREARLAYYRFAIETTIAGLESRLQKGAPPRQSGGAKDAR